MYVYIYIYILMVFKKSNNKDIKLKVDDYVRIS